MINVKRRLKNNWEQQKKMMQDPIKDYVENYTRLRNAANKIVRLLLLSMHARPEQQRKAMNKNF